MHWLLPEPGEGQAPPWPVSDFPAGLLYGACVYTTFRHPIEDHWLRAHLARLKESAQAIGLAWHDEDNRIKEMIAACVHGSAPVVRLSVFADVNAYGDFFRNDLPPARLVLSLREAPDNSQPVRLQNVSYQRPMPTIKTGMMAELILHKRYALTNGFDDVLLLNSKNRVTEASTANVFFIRKDGCLLTPDPERDGCLPGITRMRILEIAEENKIPVITDDPITPDSYSQCDGAFLTNAVQGIIPVHSTDSIVFPWPDHAKALLSSFQSQAS